MYFCWGTMEKIKHDISAGIDFCPNCQQFTNSSVGRKLKIKHFNYIPLKTTVLDYFVMCRKCSCGKTISQNDYFELKRIHEPFKKKKLQMKCFEKAAQMAENMEATQISVNTIMDTLAAEYPIRTSPQLEGIYRRRVEMLLATHGKGGDPQALMQQAAPPSAQPQTPRERKPAVMDEI